MTEGRLTNRYDPAVLEQRRVARQQARIDAVHRGEMRPFALVETTAEYLRRITAAIRTESADAIQLARAAGVEVPNARS